MLHLPFTIVGGGIIGLLIALEIKKSFPDEEVALFEKSAFFGDHTTGRNSGVLHAGIYYPKDSLKTRLCLSGNRYWKQLALDLSIPIKHCGKFIVACKEEEILYLEKLFEHCKKCDVPGIRWGSIKENAALTRWIRNKRSLFSENTAIVDVPFALKQFIRILGDLGANIMASDEVLKITQKRDNFIIKTSYEEFSTDTLINAAGLEAVSIRKQMGLYDVEDYWVKGNYLQTRQSFNHNSLIYPVPSSDLKGLGVHLTFDFDNKMRFGPDTEDVNEISYNMNPNLIERMTPAISKVFKNVNPALLSLDYSGIRPKIKHNGKIYPDFWIKASDYHGIKGYIELLGMESPGLTASPAVAKYVLDLVKNEFLA